jgi:molybdate transport system substrate-binding protein
MKMKKKLIALGLALGVMFSMSACGSGTAADNSAGTSADAEPVTIYVSAAASMTESLDEIIANYTAEHQNVTITPTYDSSGTLLTQIQSGADCDIFISAAQKQMNAIDEAEGGDEYEGTNFVAQGTRVDLLQNKCALVVSPSTTKTITNWSDFETAIKGAQSASDLIFCMGNSDVPVGQYTSAILENLGLNEADMVSKGIVTYGTNVKEVTSQVSSGAADCGIIYATDAYSAGLDVTDTASDELVGKKVIYPAAVMSGSANQEAAQAFLDYLQSDDAMAVFEKVGFSKVA